MITLKYKTTKLPKTITTTKTDALHCSVCLFLASDPINLLTPLGIVQSLLQHSQTPTRSFLHKVTKKWKTDALLVYVSRIALLGVRLILHLNKTTLEKTSIYVTYSWVLSYRRSKRSPVMPIDTVQEISQLSNQ